MNYWVKQWVRLYRYWAGVLCTGWVLFFLLSVLLKGSLLAVEPNTSWLVFEICLIGFALVLQFVPLKD